MVSSTHESCEECVPSCGWNIERKLDNVNLSVDGRQILIWFARLAWGLRTGIIWLKKGPVDEVLWTIRFRTTWGIFEPLLAYQGKLCSVVFIHGHTWVERWGQEQYWTVNCLGWQIEWWNVYGWRNGHKRKCMKMIQCCTNSWLSSGKKCTVVCLQVVATAAFCRHISLICDIITRRSE